MMHFFRAGKWPHGHALPVALNPAMDAASLTTSIRKGET